MFCGKKALYSYGCTCLAGEVTWQRRGVVRASSPCKHGHDGRATRKFGIVQISRIPGNIICGSLIPWGWGWLHRSWSFAIPKLRLRLPPRIEP